MWRRSTHTGIQPTCFVESLTRSDITSIFDVSTHLPCGTATWEPEPTQQSGQIPDKEVEIKKNITVYGSGYTETDPPGMLSTPTVWRQQSEFVSSRQSGQILAAVRIGFECRCNGQNGCRFKCSHTFLRCIPRQMLFCCVVSVLSPM